MAGTTAPKRVAIPWLALLSWLGVLGMGLIGLVWGLIAAVVIAFVFEGAGPDAMWRLIGVYSFLVLVPAGFACWAHDRHMYGLAGGMSTCWLVVVVFALHPWGDEPAMSDREIDRETRRIVASGTPAYYVGDETGGQRLDEIYRDGEFGAKGVSVGYGLHCDGGDLGCSSDVYVRTLSMSRWYVDSYGCERLDPVLGVPAVKRTTDQTMILFTGRSLVSLEAWASESPLESELALARRLRPLGESEAVTTLPALTPSTLRYLDRHCAA